MGKKSRDREDGEAVKSLFGTDNSDGRKPQPEVDAGANTLPTKKARLEISGVSSDARKKRRSDREITAATLSPLSSDEEPFKKKRKKIVVDAEVNGLEKKKNKRKRVDVESEYEKRKFDCVGEKKPAATVLAIGEKRKANAAAADMVDTEGPFDDESKLLRTVFVRNLPLKTRAKALNREFARFGEIESVRIRSLPLVDAKAPRKAAVRKGQISKEAGSMNAYIVFKDEQTAHVALSNNMTEIGGNHIRVDMTCPPCKKMKGVAQLYDRKRTVFVGNILFDVKDEELYQLFCGPSQLESNVEAVCVIRDPNTSIGKGIAYVLFKTKG